MSNLKEYVVVVFENEEPKVWTKIGYLSWKNSTNMLRPHTILATFWKDSPYQGSAGVWVKASERLPKVGIYNALYNGDHVIFQVHDGGFRVINYHGEKNDSPKLFLIRYLDDSAASPGGDGWVRPKDKLPEKPGKKHYEQIPFLVIHRGDMKILVWNCEHICWDDESGDDYFCDPNDVDYYRELPSPPKTSA